MNLEDAIKEAYALAPTGKVILHTLELRQEGVQDPIFLVQSRRGVTALDENGTPRYFEPSGFQFTLPPSDEEGYQSLSVSIQNIGRRVTEFVDLAQSEMVPVQMIYRPYLSDDLSTPQMNPPLLLFLKDIEMNVLQVTGTATFMDIINKKFPSELYARDRFPTLG